MSRSFKINNYILNENSPTFIIAEVGINHNGEIRDAFSLIKKAFEAGADAVKLQSYITEKRVSKDSPVFDILKKSELTNKEQLECFQLGKDLGIIVFSTPFDDESVDYLESIECPLYKVASFDTVNNSLLRRIGKTMKPIIMSTGMSNLDEVKNAKISLNINNSEITDRLALLHCISSYPTPENEANLSVIPLLRQYHNGIVGYSDHTIGIDVPILSVAAGAKIIEKHFTLDTNAEGPDHALSADPETMKKMVSGIRKIEKIMGDQELKSRLIEKEILPYRRFTD